MDLRPEQTTHRLRLYTRSQGLPARTLAFRLGLVFGLIVLFALINIADRDGLTDQIDGHVSVLDVIYFTIITTASVGYGDIVPVTDAARLIDTLYVGPVRLFIWFVLLGTAYQFVVQKVMEDFRVARLQRQLNNHVVICGFGDSGGIAAAEMIAAGHKAEQVVVVDRSEAAVQAAAADGHVGLLGDSTLQKTLLEAGIAKARAVVVCVGRDDTAVLTVLTVRQFNAAAKVICSAKEEENVDLLKQAGANTVVVPSRISGYLLADALDNTFVAEYVADLLTRGGNVRMAERTVRADEVGLRLRDVTGGLAVRIHRNGESIGFWDEAKAVLRPGDVILVIEAERPAAAS